MGVQGGISEVLIKYFKKSVLFGSCTLSCCQFKSNFSLKWER